MRKIAVAFILLPLLAAVALAQSAPTLRIVTEDPTLPSELFYGNIKVKPLRLRPGTNPPVPITIDDSDFFVMQHYIDFLSRFPEQQGFDNWMAFLKNCPAGDAVCLHNNRLTASAGFFGSPEFRIKGYFAYRFYKASLARQPLYAEIVVDMRNLTAPTGPEVEAKRTAFVAAWVIRADFLTSFPRSMDPPTFVDAILAKAGITVSNRQTIIDNLSAANNTDAGRAVALRAIVESPEEDTKEFNRAFVFMQYAGYLRRDPEEPGYTNWLKYLNGPPSGDFSEMIRGFVDSVEYRNRF